MYTYNYGEDANTAIMNRARVYRDAAALFPAIRATAEAFDGKVYNCRFEKALRDNSGAWICTEKRYKWMEIYIYDHGSRILLASVGLDCLPDGKRIPADLIIESAREKREGLLKRAADLEAVPAKAQTLQAQFKKLSDMVDALRDSIPYEAQDIYRLGYRVTLR